MRVIIFVLSAAASASAAIAQQPVQPLPKVEECSLD